MLVTSYEQMIRYQASNQTWHLICCPASQLSIILFVEANWQWFALEHTRFAFNSFFKVGESTAVVFLGATRTICLILDGICSTGVPQKLGKLD